MLDPDTIKEQLALLATHRRTLAHLIAQAAQYGGEVFAPPQTANGIAEARANIARIKAVLRAGGVEVGDALNDEAPPQVEPVQLSRAGGDVVMGDKVGGDKVMGDKTTINTGGGDYAAGNIDKRTFVTQAAPLPPALHQIQAPVRDFVGRTNEIDQLVSALSATNSGAAATIAVVRGLGGAGKSELAYAVASQLRDAFPDAQLLVELRGARSNPLSPEQALQRIIHSFEREAKLPDDLSQLKGAYNSVLNGKQVLILADDAKDTAQVRPLVPPPGCALLITSRNHFPLPGMTALNLGTLLPEDAEKLLLKICPRVGGHAAKLAKLCGYLAVALRVSASLLETNETRDVADYLEHLETERLRQLTDPDNPDDPQASVEASLRFSYAALAPLAQRILTQMSVFPTSFDLEAAKAIVSVEEDIVAVLELLGRRSLLDWAATVKRYSLHDLVRAFAAARLDDADAVRLQHARHYAQVADAADTFYLDGGTATLTGLALFDRERAHIDAGWAWARERAGEQDADALLLDYANATAYIGDLRYDTRRERIPQLEGQLAAAQRLKRRSQEGRALGKLGNAYYMLGEARTAISFFEQSLEIAREIGDQREEGIALGNLGNAHAALGEARQAITIFSQQLEIARKLGDRRGEGKALGNLGGAHYALGEVRTAIIYREQRLEIARQIGDRLEEANALGNLGNAYYMLGEARTAISFFAQQLEIARKLGDRRGEGKALGNLGNAYDDLGDARTAITFHEQELEIARETGNRRGEGIALGNLGNAYYMLEDARKVITFHEQYLEIAREIGDRRGEGIALSKLGNAYATLGDAHRAISFYQQRLQIAREIGDRRGEAESSWNLGLALEKQGDLVRAAELMQVCVGFLSEIGHADAEKCAAKLEQLRQQIAGEGSAAVTGEGV